MQLRPDGIARRVDVTLQCDTEKIIGRAMEEIEKMPAHTFLTEAVLLLSQAKNKVADFIELPENQNK